MNVISKYGFFSLALLALSLPPAQSAYAAPSSLTITETNLSSFKRLKGQYTCYAPEADLATLGTITSRSLRAGTRWRALSSSVRDDVELLQKEPADLTRGERRRLRRMNRWERERLEMIKELLERCEGDNGETPLATPTRTPSGTNTPSRTPTVQPTETARPVETRTPTPRPTQTQTPRPTQTQAPRPTETPRPTATSVPATPTVAPTRTATSVPTRTPTAMPTSPVASGSVRISPQTSYQTIDGFGFFGAKNVWWGSPSTMYDSAWGEKIIKDLGISIWRNEYYAAPTAGNPQDADWNKQRPVVEGIARTARQNNVNLKVVLTVWSPPGDMKCQVTEDVQVSTARWPNGTKGGGTLCLDKYDDFADWLIQGIQMYKDVGVDVYAISPQNEPLFWQPYNSCFYAQQWYADMLSVVGPRIKARFPGIKIFGAENMLEMEAGKDKQWFYNTAIKNTPAALQSIDIFAVHGYSDGVAPTATSQMTKLWESSRQDYVDGARKPVWMTETSGFVDAWEGSDGKPGALDLGFAIHSALFSGHSSGWIWWQGSADEINEYSLMNGANQLSKRYYVSKHFYRFIRPGAKMVDVQVNQDGVFASAYLHQQMGAFTVVLLNSSNEAKTVRLEGNNVPSQFTQYRSTSAENCEERGTVSKDSITLPAKSIVTLVNGDVFE